jgi:hypothetical protein
LTNTNGEITSRRETGSTGHGGFTDIENLRIATRGLSCPGNFLHQATLANSLKTLETGNRRVVSSRPRQFQIETLPVVSNCKFGGISFKVIQGTCYLENPSFDPTGSPQVVPIDRSKKSKSVELLQAT